MRGYQKQWRLLRSIPKSLWFCLHYLPLRQAVRLPILVSHRTMLQGMGGTVTLTGPVRPGMVRIGFGWLPTADWKARGSWSVSGDVVFEGTALIVHGVKIAVTGRLIFGDDVFINADTSIEAVTTVTIGAGSI